MAELSRASETEAGYDAVAKDYVSRTSVRSAAVEAFAERFLLELKPSSLVVDLGSGTGADASAFTNAGHCGVAVDRSAKLLALGEAGLKLRADLGSLPIVDGAADALWSHASLLHVEPEMIGVTFDEWERILRPGGLVAIATSLGGDSGWELAPAAPSRIPVMPSGTRRWFVHHEEMALVQQMEHRRWTVVESSRRKSHRDWLLAIARVPKN